MRDRVRDERGGALLKVLLAAMLLVIGASIAFYWYAERQAPLALGNAEVGWNDLLDASVVEETGDPPTVAFESGGRVYVATFVTNTGRFPITLEGLGKTQGRTSALYSPVAMFPSDGDSTDPALASPAEPVSLDPGQGAGVLIVFAPNPDLACERLPAPDAGSGQSLASFPVRFTTYGVPTTQQVGAATAFVRIARPTVDTCEEVVAQATG
ncbi:MAG: hypothetical protein ACXWWX_04615 [Actinomycetota bacterium]